MLSQSIEKLTSVIGGNGGRAKSLWKTLSSGNEPSYNGKAFDSIRHDLMANYGLLWKPGDAARVTEETVADDYGGRKILHELHDGLMVESVVIPHERLNRTTLCVSSQVGCERGCVFCATGKMGLIRNLDSEEILAQVLQGLMCVKRHGLAELTNVVFMGMGDIGMNIEAVKRAVEGLVDPHRFAFAPSKITLSTVGPNLEIFDYLCRLPTGIAWSLHSHDKLVRRKLVPSSGGHDPEVLRDGLIEAVKMHRTGKRGKSLMIAITMLGGINCREEDALGLVEFLRPFGKEGIKVNVDLIPYNDIGFRQLRGPTSEEIVAFKQVLWEHKVQHSVRWTRGEKERAACGMLATNRKEVGKKRHG
jgi:23S rRNA (adenine2503-C2)-methyltransferase